MASEKNKLKLIEFASRHDPFFLQELNACDGITKNHSDRRRYTDELVEDKIFWSDVIESQGKESKRYVLVERDYLLSHPRALLHLLGEELFCVVLDPKNPYLSGNFETIFPNFAHKAKHPTFKHLEECGDRYKFGLDKSLPYLQIIRKSFILFLLISEISKLEGKRSEKGDMSPYSEKSWSSALKWCNFVNDFIKFVENYQTYLDSHNHDFFKTLAEELDHMYESNIYYYNFLRYHNSTLKDRINIARMLHDKTKGYVAREFKISPKQITNITRPIMKNNGKPDPKKLANLQDKERGHFFIEQVKQEDIDDLLRLWKVKV